MKWMLLGAWFLLAGCGGADTPLGSDPPAPAANSTASRAGSAPAAGSPPVLATAELLDGRQLTLTSTDRGLCLVLSGVDDSDRQCGVAPSSREPEIRRALLAGPIAQRGKRGPLEVYGETSAAVNDVRIRYSLGTKRYMVFATILYAIDREALRQAGIERRFGYYLAELPARARRVTATARDRHNRVIARDDYRDFRDLDRSVFIAQGNARPLPTVPVRRTVGRFDRVRVPVRGRGRFYVSVDSPQPQVACVTLRGASVRGGRIATLDEADGEGGGSGWCPGQHLGTVVDADRELVARFSYRVR